MRYSVSIFSLIALCALVSLNTSGGLMWAAVTGLVISMGLLALAAFPLPRLIFAEASNGRYLATVSASEYGRPCKLWSGRFHSRLIATLAAKRHALRMDFMGDAYSQFQLKCEVSDLKRWFKHGQPSAAARLR